MPIYEYETPDGRVEQHIRPVSRREIPGLKRMEVPSSLNVVTCAALPPTDQKTQVLKGYQALEDSGKPWKSEYSKEQIRRIWAT